MIRDGQHVPHVRFTDNIQRHVGCPPAQADGDTVRAVLDAYFAANVAARGYVLDDQGGLRKHMVIFVDGRQITDRIGLADSVPQDGLVEVIQALSGG